MKNSKIIGGDMGVDLSVLIIVMIVFMLLAISYYFMYMNNRKNNITPTPISNLKTK
jgi:flagellar basal body-associated protein FliL